MCSVCDSDITKDDIVVCLPCKHLYHPDCILPWIKKVSALSSLPFSITPAPHAVTLFRSARTRMTCTMTRNRSIGVFVENSRRLQCWFFVRIEFDHRVAFPHPICVSTDEWMQKSVLAKTLRDHCSFLLLFFNYSSIQETTLTLLQPFRLFGRRSDARRSPLNHLLCTLGVVAL